MLILVDGDSLIYKYVYQNYVACGGYIIKDLIKLASLTNADGILFIWDGGSQRRKQICPIYKDRKVDQAIIDRKNSLKKETQNTLRVFGIPQCLIQGEEADDIIATFVNTIMPDEQFVIYANDHDFYSLLNNGKIRIWDGKDFMFEKKFREDYCIAPSEWIKFRSLVGDHSDNISGVKGIGPVKGTEVINSGTYGDYAELPEVKMAYQLLSFLPVDEESITNNTDFGSIDIRKMRHEFEFYKLGEDLLFDDCYKVYNQPRMRQWRLSCLQNDMSICNRCKLYQTAKNIVTWRGGKDAQVLIIGEAPGEEEDDMGEPMIGPAGRVLREWIPLMGLVENDVLISNIVWHHPNPKEGSGKANRKPTPTEISTCGEVGISRLIKYMMPKNIICLGEVAASYVMGRGVKITKEHGPYKVHRFGLDLDVFLTLHPAALLYDSMFKTLSYSDLESIKRWLGR